MPVSLSTLRRLLPVTLSFSVGMWLFVSSSLHFATNPLEGITFLPMALMEGLACILLFLRWKDPLVCLTAVYLVLLAVLAHDNTVGLEALAVITSHPMKRPPSHYLPVHLVWMLGLGIVPLLFAWIYTQEERNPFLLRQKPLKPLLFLFGTLLAQGLCLSFAWQKDYGFPWLRTILEDISSPYHRLFFCGFPLLLVQSVGAIWLLARYVPERGEEQLRAFVLFYSMALLFLVSVVVNDALAMPLTSLLTNSCVYFVPITLVYLLERHALFNLRIVIRRAAQYALARQAVNLITLTPLVAFAFWFGLSLNQTPPSSPALAAFRDSTWLNITVTGGLSLGMFLLMVAVRLPLLHWMERTYFREVYNAQHVLEAVGRSLLGLSDTRIIARVALDGIAAELHPVPHA